MRLMRRLLLAACLPVALAACANAQTSDAPTGKTLTVTVHGVATAEGVLRGQLCTDREKFPGGACPYRVEASAAMGNVDVAFRDVAPGTYAFQVMHDANSNGQLDLPHEGFAFGNNAAWPPSFEQAALKVDTDTAAGVSLTYYSQGSTAGAEVGVPPRLGIVKTDVRANGLYGALYAPEEAKNLPVLIAIGGSEGGLNPISGISSSFASNDYAVLALAYWRAPGLPQTLQNIPLEYFSSAIDWLEMRPETDASRIGMMGWSRGGEGALLVASGEPRIKAVMGMSPGSHVMVGLNFANAMEAKPAWTRNGVGLPYFTMPASAAQQRLSMREMIELGTADALKRPETAIPVETINGPILLLSGEKDAIWNADANSERVLARLKAHGFKFKAEHIDYPGAGHLVFSGDPQGQSYVLDPATREFMGGEDAANAAAQKDSWTKVLAFFDGALKAVRP